MNARKAKSFLPSDWRDLRLPAGLVGAILTGSVISYVWATGANGLAFASDVRALEQKFDRRGLESEQRRLNVEVIKGKAKEEAMPKQFNAVDRAALKENERVLKEVEDELKKLNQVSK